MNDYLIPAGPAQCEISVLNSRFIASLAPAFSVEEARAFIAATRAAFADATHNVPAFLVGHGNRVIAHCSDDGEPSGTAGRPMLAVLRGSGLGDVAVVVTRYYGGTNLGTGGLVRAYSDAVRVVLAETRRARKMLTHTVMLATPYPLFEQVQLLAADHRAVTLDSEFAADVTLTLRFTDADLPPFTAALRELSHGALEVVHVLSDPDTIVPVDD